MLTCSSDADSPCYDTQHEILRRLPKTQEKNSSKEQKKQNGRPYERVNHVSNIIVDHINFCSVFEKCCDDGLVRV
jgi:hypothetical protein